MKIQIESTTKVVMLKTAQGDVPARVWEGHTESGVPVHCYITRIGVPDGRPVGDYMQFDEELKKCREPSPEVQAIPLAFIL